MDCARFETLLRSVAQPPSRRQALRFLSGLTLGTLMSHDPLATRARKRGKGKKKGKTKRGAQPPCPPPPPGPGTPPRTPTSVSCPGPVSAFFSGQRRFAKTFTAPTGGHLIFAQLEVSNVAEGTDFTLEIRSLTGAGVPTATVLGTARVEGVQVTPNAGALTLHATFSPAVPVQANTGYALAVTVDAGQAFDINGRGIDTCPGDVFADTFATDAFFQIGPADLIFTVLILA